MKSFAVTFCLCLTIIVIQNLLIGIWTDAPDWWNGFITYMGGFVTGSVITLYIWRKDHRHA